MKSTVSTQEKIFERTFVVLASCVLTLALGCTTQPSMLIPPVAVFPSGAAFSLELADTPDKRQVGYMHRKHVPSDEGMLFFFDEPERYPFWMKNCHVHLDIIWLDDTFKVVEIAHDVPPCPEVGDCPTVFPMRPASYVLEVAGGMAAREGLQRGDPITVYLEEPTGS